MNQSRANLNSADSLEVANQLLQATVTRLNHIEQLLLGLATLAIAGWGFFYATQAKVKSNADHEALLWRTLFALLFSGLVGSAFNALYMGRMGINRALIALEDWLGPPVAPYRGFMQDAGLWTSLVVFGLPALFMPLLALGAVVFSLYGTRDQLSATGRGVVRTVALISILVVVVTMVASLAKTVAVVSFGTHERTGR